MTPEWQAVLNGFLVLGMAGVGVVLLFVAALGLTGGEARRGQRLSFDCPRTGQPVSSTLVQDVRTGQWREVLDCSAFTPPSAVACDRECAQAMNLGFPPGARPEAARRLAAKEA
jgi:hypothetical protein